MTTPATFKKGLMDPKLKEEAKQRRDAIFATAKSFVPSDVNFHSVEDITVDLLLQVQMTRSMSLSLLITGAIRAALTGVPRENVLNLVTSLMDLMEKDEEIKKHAEAYLAQNAMLKAEAAATKKGTVAAPKTKYTM